MEGLKGPIVGSATVEKTKNKLKNVVVGSYGGVIDKGKAQRMKINIIDPRERLIFYHIRQNEY